ncbi:MAG: hydrolase [Gemmatimonadaceae bacterium]
MTRYHAAWWLPGAHAQTLWGKLVRREPKQPTTSERWITPDGDFLDIHRLTNPSTEPRLLILHGLEGTVLSQYAQKLIGDARNRGWSADMLIFRSCSPEMNLTKRFYHSGDTADVGFVIDRIVGENPYQPLLLAGVSLGGNVLLKYLGEKGDALPPQIKAAAAVSAPFDLARASNHINQGFARVYQRHFIKSLRQKTLKKLERFPDLISADRLMRIGTMYEFDDAVTAPVHGFRDADDYYSSSSSLAWIDRISIPTLLLNARDDPFLPKAVLDDVRRVARKNACLELDFPEHGGHVGFVTGWNPFRSAYYAEQRACDFLARHIHRDVALPNIDADRGRHVSAQT